MDQTTKNNLHRREWLMLCLERNRPPHPLMLHQIQVQPPATNAELFQFLAKAYNDKRERYRFWMINIRPFWRYVKTVHFVCFETFTPLPQMSAQIRDIRCEPDQAHGWTCKHFAIDGSIMARYLYNPDLAGEGCSIYDCLPKRVSPLPPRGGLDGWGLYFEEESWRPRGGIL
jgi:hypothetical protein